MWDLQIQTDKGVMDNQPDVVLVEKADKKAAGTDVGVPGDRDVINDTVRA